MDAPVRRVSRTPAGVTCEDVAQVLGVTPQRVQQLEQRALWPSAGPGAPSVA